MPTIAECVRIVETTPNEQAILFYGPHGTGKSEVQKQIAERSGMVFKAFFLGQQSDVSDLLGLLAKDEENERSYHLFPEWFPRGEQPVYLLFDELNRAEGELLSAIMDLVLNRTFNGKPLPAGSRIVACINPPDESGKYDVNELDEALLSRFNCYAWTPSTEEWLEHAIKSGVHRMVVSYISKHPDRLERNIGKNSTNGSKQVSEWKSPDRRAWFKVSDWLNKNENFEFDEPDFTRLCISGLIGHSVAAHFMEHVRDTGRGLDIGKFLVCKNKKEKELMMEQIKQLTVQELSNVNMNIEMWFDNNTESLLENQLPTAFGKTVFGNVRDYIGIVPDDVSAEFASRIIESHNNSKDWGFAITVVIPSIVKRVISIKEAKAA